MSNTITSPNMNLPVPVTGQDPGPQYANDVNSCLTIVDGHNHSSGSGVPINPSGLNISSDLPMLNNNLTMARSVRFSQVTPPIPGSAPDLICVYASGVDLYFNDGNGNQVRITQSGGIAGSPGSISNLTSPASAAYVSGTSTFVWQSAANTPANMDGGSFIFRNVSANSNGITVSAPNSLGSNYSLILPAIPGAQSFMTLDNSGNMAAPWTVDNSSIQISSSQVGVKPHGITQGLLALKPSGTAAGDVSVSSSCGSFTTTSNTGGVQITNFQITLTTTGRPVQLVMQPDGTGSTSIYGSTAGGGLTFYQTSPATSIYCDFGIPADQVSAPLSYLIVGLAAGTYQFTAFGRTSGAGTLSISNYVFMAYEI